MDACTTKIACKALLRRDHIRSTLIQKQNVLYLHFLLFKFVSCVNLKVRLGWRFTIQCKSFLTCYEIVTVFL